MASSGLPAGDTKKSEGLTDAAHHHDPDDADCQRVGAALLPTLETTELVWARCSSPSNGGLFLSTAVMICPYLRCSCWASRHYSDGQSNLAGISFGLAAGDEVDGVAHGRPAPCWSAQSPRVALRGDE